MKLIWKGFALFMLFIVYFSVSPLLVNANPCDDANIGSLDSDSWCYVAIDQFGYNRVGNWLTDGGCSFNYMMLYPGYYRCYNDELSSDHYNTCSSTDSSIIEFAYLRGCSWCDDYSKRESIQCPAGYLCEDRGGSVSTGGAYCKFSKIGLRATNSFCGLTKINSFYRSYPSTAYNPSTSDTKLRVINNITDTTCPDGESCIVLSGYGAVESTHSASASSEYLLAINVKRNLGNPSLQVNVVEYNSNGDIVNTSYASITPPTSGVSQMLNHRFTTTTSTSSINITFRQTINLITNELYFSPYFGQSTSCTEAGNCNNGLDDDFDNAIDYADSDCQVQLYCPNFTNEALVNGAASDGSDGCCGDDGMRACVAGNALIYPPPCTYVTRTECQANLWCKWNPSNYCELKTRPEYCAQFSQSDCPSGACQFQEGDYGYVTPDNKYLCYNNKTNFFGGTTDKWMWISAYQNPFMITPLNFSGKTVDYISNSQNWYYCGANANNLYGSRIDEYKTFPDPSVGGLTMTCSEAATFLTMPYGQLPYEECATAQGPNCCVDQTGAFNIVEHPEMLKECYCRTASITGQEVPFCEIEENKDLPLCKDYTFTQDKILTEFCAQNPRNCVTLDQYDASKACNNQPFQSGHNCSWSTQVCSNGIVLPVLNGEQCCIGSSASCIDKSQITNTQICEESGGKPYFPSNTTFCLPNNQSIEMSPEEGACCFGAILYTDSFPWSSFENRNNNTFSCFAYQGNSLFGQCCYDANCNGMSLFTPVYVDSTRNRAFSLKLPYNIQNSYDLNNATAGILQDYSWRTSIPNFEFYQIAYFTGKKNISMAYYDNLEFDVIYNQLSTIKNIYINDVDYGSILNYVSNGDKRGVAHHVRIPLKPESKMDMLRKIRTVTNSSTVNVLYDNIYFSINTDTPESSLNYYCTGGFGSWIDDLDSPITDPNNIFFTGDDAYMKGYGQYASACNAYLPYGWTGHRCCGDDTNQTNYGEYYEDSPTLTWPTTGGCFRGSEIVDGETVWKVKGYVEDNAYFFDSSDELKLYMYSDIIYSNDAFIGCQVPTTKYPDLKISYDGATQTNTNLINDFVDDSCAVIGTYYCMNGIWRQYIPGLNQSYKELNNIYLPAIPSQLELKSVPPAAELIKNGDFGGEDPRGGGGR